MPHWPITEMTGYKPKTTFWQDFCIADAFGTNAVKDTFGRAFKEWRNNTEYLTELVLVLNHKIWQHHNAKNEPLARIYDDLWRKLDMWCYENLKGADLEYYYHITD